jgi:hypothetical protein
MKFINQRALPGKWKPDYRFFVERLANAIEARMAKGAGLETAADAAVRDIKAPDYITEHPYSDEDLLKVLAKVWEHGEAFRSYAHKKSSR